MLYRTRLEWGSLIVTEDNSKVGVGVERSLHGSRRRNAVPPPTIEEVHESGTGWGVLMNDISAVDSLAETAHSTLFLTMVTCK